MAVSNPSLSNPKRRELARLTIPIARTDSGTVKAWLPKDAIIADISIHQTVNATTAAGSFTLGLGADADGIVETFSMATTKVGLVKPGVSAGVALGVKQTSDLPITSTYTVGSSTAGGTGYVLIDFFIAGPGEQVDD